MPPVARILWMVVPPAIYFLVLGRRRSGRFARVVSGSIDATWLTFGFGGFVVFGPIGQTLWSGASGFWSSAALATAGAASRRSGSARAARLVVYNVAPETFDDALREAIVETRATMVKTVRGYEDPVGGVTFIVDNGRHSRTAELSAEGPGCERRLRDLDPRLRKALARRPADKAVFAWNDFVLANLILAAPVVLVLLTQPQAKADLGRWIDRMLHPVVKSPAPRRSGRETRRAR